LIYGVQAALHYSNRQSENFSRFMENPCARPWVKYGFIREQQKACPATVPCDVMQVGKSTYSAWAKRPGTTGKDRERQQL
jgi:hypothetical protein